MPFQRLSPRPRSRRSGVNPLQVVLGLSLLLNLWFFFTWAPQAEGEKSDGEAEATSPSSGADSELPTERQPQDSEAVASASQPASSGVDTAPAAAGEGTSSAQGDTPAQSADSDAATLSVEAAAEEPEALDIPARFIRVSIQGAISRGFVKQLGSPLGDRLALTMSRLLVWNMNLQKDPRPGDTVDVLFEVDEEGMPRVLGLRYNSAKFGKEFGAWKFQPAGWTYPSWFDSSGREVAGRLEDSPIAEYEEVTSLLGDGRGHSGMDFKAPVGTPITAPFDGTVTRVNWSFKYNGNCLELRSANGTTARFLHLSGVEAGVVKGTRVRKGQKLALSGNTGRSSAPHLHYELSSASGKTLDPLKFHEVEHVRLAEANAASFAARLTELQGWMEKGVASAQD